MGPDERALEQTQDLISRTARRLKRQPEFRGYDAEDIEQSIKLALVAGWHRYDSGRGTELQLALTIIPNAAKSLLRFQRAQRRDDSALVSLSAAAEPTAPDGQTDRVDERLDLAWLLDQLDEPLRELCQRLAKDGPTTVSRQTGIPRSSIYRCLARARMQARRGGMEC